MTELLPAFSRGKQIKKAKARLSSFFRLAYGHHTANSFLRFFAASTGEADDVGNEPEEAQYKPNEISSYPQPRNTAKMSDVGEIKTATVLKKLKELAEKAPS